MPENFPDDTTQVRRPRGGDSAPGDDKTVVGPRSQPAKTSALPAFLGTLAALVLFAILGGAAYFGYHLIQSRSSDSIPAVAENPAPKTKGANPLNDSATWELGQEPAKKLSADSESDIGWWARTFDLPNSGVVLGYFKNQGVSVSRVVPLHYEDTKDATTLTYQLYGEVPAQLLRVPKASWVPKNPDMAPFTSVLVLNNGLPAGQFWNAQNPTVAEEAGTKLNFEWKVQWDKTANTVTTDRLPYTAGVFTQQQVEGFQTEAANTLSQLQGRIQAINAKVAADVQAKLAAVPANPPKPELMSSKWNHGDGSGEPTKSAERIGGGTAAGAAGGAAFGAAAGDAGLGAGIGAGVGLLGGFLYDTVSKNNDRHAYERRAAAENAERLGAWRAQIKVLDQQRSQIKKDAESEKQQLLQDLAQRIAAANGHLDSIPAEAEAPQEVPKSSDVPQTQPTSDQPSGAVLAPQVQVPSDDAPNRPVLGDPAQMTADTSSDLGIKKSLIGYWKSPRHAYCRNTDGIQYMMQGASTKNSWDVHGGAYYEDGTAYDILTLNAKKFVYRSRDVDRTTFTETRITREEAQRE